jgi:hypothetical protein
VPQGHLPCGIFTQICSEVSELILRGKGRIPESDGRETPEQVWQIVNSIRSMQATGVAPKSQANFSAVGIGPAKGPSSAISDDRPSGKSSPSSIHAPMCWDLLLR